MAPRPDRLREHGRAYTVDVRGDLALQLDIIVEVRNTVNLVESHVTWAYYSGNGDARRRTFGP